MKEFIFVITLIAGVSCQIYTKLHADGYHYDKPAPEAQLIIPQKPSCPNGGSGPFCCINGAGNENCEIPRPFEPPPRPLPINSDLETIPTLPPLPSFIPQINLPKIIKVKPTEKPLSIVPNPIVPESPDPDFDIRIIDDPPPLVPSQPQFSVPTTTKSPNEYLPPLADEVSEWDAWKNKFNKRYDSPEEENHRRLIFEENVNKINSHNADFAAGIVSFELDINKYADLERDEFVRFHTGIKRKGRSESQSPSKFYGAPYSSSARVGLNVDLGFNQVGLSDSGRTSLGSGFSSSSVSGFGQTSSSSGFGSAAGAEQGQNMMNVFMASDSLESEVKDEVDWRKEGAITPVKNQGKCASCWAFSANGALEAHNFLRKRTGPIPLSEQNLIDCVKDNDGCDGGYMTYAYEYAARNPGVDTEASYPYEAANKTCRFKPENVGGDAMTHMEIQIGNEKALQQAVATVGPVAAGIDGAQLSFQFYKSGYYYEPKCEQDVNHAVLIVGYGKTENGEEYWICKNSWDTDWGEEGYIRMARNRNNNCGISNLASYPIV